MTSCCKVNQQTTIIQHSVIEIWSGAWTSLTCSGFKTQHFVVFAVCRFLITMVRHRDPRYQYCSNQNSRSRSSQYTCRIQSQFAVTLMMQWCTIMGVMEPNECMKQPSNSERAAEMAQVHKTMGFVISIFNSITCEVVLGTDSVAWTWCNIMFETYW